MQQVMNLQNNKGRTKTENGNGPQENGRSRSKAHYICRQIPGKIKFFDYKRGYGFLVSEEIHEDGK